MRKNKKEPVPSVSEAMEKLQASMSEFMQEPKEESKPAEEWIWVDGYKGTDKDMKCRDFQYELLKVYDMPEDAKIKECESGFHLCLEKRHVFSHYNIYKGNRFFKVKALVRKSDYENYGKIGYPFLHGNDKLAAKSIMFISELTVEEIFEGLEEDCWPIEDKQKALEIGVQGVTELKTVNLLMSYGYSEVFSKMLLTYDRYVIDAAIGFGSQPDLSMDMKVWGIFKAVGGQKNKKRDIDSIRRDLNIPTINLLNPNRYFERRMKL